MRRKKERAVKSFKKCGISNATDCTEDELLLESEDENEVVVDSPDSDWDPYYNETVNDDNETVCLDSKKIRTNLAMARIDYQKAYDSVQH